MPCRLKVVIDVGDVIEKCLKFVAAVSLVSLFVDVRFPVAIKTRAMSILPEQQPEAIHTWSTRRLSMHGSMHKYLQRHCDRGR